MTISNTNAPVRPAESEIAEAAAIVDRISTQWASQVVGQHRLRETLLVALIADGHVLLESVPGLAKTTAATAIAHAIDASFKRIQCTPDLLPSDIVGTQIYDVSKNAFETQLGPVHANIVLLDEINRSSAKTQSAMLESMQERQTSIGGVIYPLPEPFLVLATQNPIEQEGTYALPEAQLDRFMFKDLLDYPSPDEEAEVLNRVAQGRFARGRSWKPAASLDEIMKLRGLAERVYVDQAVVQYIVGLSAVSRDAGRYLADGFGRFVQVGASPRASIALYQGARAMALLQRRDYVIPEDVKYLAHRVLRHRILLSFEAEAEGITSDQVVDQILRAVATP